MSNSWMKTAFPFFQLHKDHTDPSLYVCFRAIHNKAPYVHNDTGRVMNDTVSLYNANMQLGDFNEQFVGKLLPELIALNVNETMPGNIYFGVNPRKNPKGNKKEDCAGYVALYLDMDGHKSYTKEQRWYQIQFFIQFGVPPTFVVDSGNGYHVYWVLKKICEDIAKAEALLRRMISLAGCKEGGNCSDVTRLLRLPGFYNQKEWYTFKGTGQKPPVCFIAWPENIEELMTNKIILPRYDLEDFKHFPPCELSNIDQYHHRALLLAPANNDATHNIMKEIVQKHGALAVGAQTALEAAQLFASTDKTTEIKISEDTTWKPTKAIVPFFEEIKWPSKKAWMKKYCLKGFDGLNVEELEKISQLYNSSSLSASELDAKIIYELIKMGFTLEAVREFWTRSELKLHRPDKEHKSPNYFRDTYYKMLEMLKSSLTNPSVQNPIESSINNQIIIDRHQFYARHGDGSLDILTNFGLDLKTVLVNVEATESKFKEWFEFSASMNNGTDTPHIYDSFIIPRAAFNSLDAFKSYLFGKMVVVADKNSALQRILNFVLNKGTQQKNLVVKEFFTRVTYYKGIYYLPTYRVEKEKVVEETLFKEHPSLQQKFSQWNWIELIPSTKEEFEKTLGDAWVLFDKVHKESLVFSVLGAMASTAMKPRFVEAGFSDLNIPTINVRGSSHTGKTETVRLLTGITGLKYQFRSISLTSSNFSLQQTLNALNFIPIIIDEFKEGLVNSKQIDVVRELVRRNYSGEAMLRGRADLGVNYSSVHGLVIVIGETPLERTANISEISRVFPVSAYVNNLEQTKEAYDKLKELKLGCILPYFLQFLVNLDAAEEIELFKGIFNKVLPKINTLINLESARVAHNVATLSYGCHLWSRFVKKHCPSLEHKQKNYSEIFIKEVKEWIEDEEISHQVEEHNQQDNSVETKAYTINETLEFIKLLNNIIDMKLPYIQRMLDLKVPLFKETKRDELFINMVIAYPAVRDYCLAQQIDMPHKRGMFLQLKAAKTMKQKWIIEVLRSCRIEENTCKCVVLHLSTLEHMGIWRAKTVPSALVTEPAPQDPSTAGKNRIKDLI